MALPLLGERICIAWGTWTYHWPLQIFGVPLLALLLIGYAHAALACIRTGTVVLTARRGTAP